MDQKTWTTKTKKVKASNLPQTDKKHPVGEEAKVEEVANFKLDFNTHPLSRSICTELKNQQNCNVNILSAQQGNILCVTATCEGSEWVEGYLVKDPAKELGLVHSKFLQNL